MEDEDLTEHGVFITKKKKRIYEYVYSSEEFVLEGNRS